MRKAKMFSLCIVMVVYIKCLLVKFMIIISIVGKYLMYTIKICYLLTDLVIQHEARDYTSVPGTCVARGPQNGNMLIGPTPYNEQYFTSTKGRRDQSYARCCQVQKLTPSTTRGDKYTFSTYKLFIYIYNSCYQFCIHVLKIFTFSKMGLTIFNELQDISYRKFNVTPEHEYILKHLYGSQQGYIMHAASKRM